ncbi:MAG: hypothetical protein IKB65_03255 [Ruminiclostridium sp.]|nr:hypothetical protein [Ruminiclostridium sp.]
MEYRFDTRISYLYSFSLFEPGYLAPEEEKVRQVRQALTRAFPQCLSDDDPAAGENPVFRDLNIVQGFLHGGGLPFPSRRFLIRDLGLTFPKVPMEETAVLFSFFPEFNAGQLIFSFKAENVDTDQLIYLRQIFGGVAPFRAKDGREQSLGQWFRTITGTLGVPVDDPDTAYLVEIKDVHPGLTADQLLETEAQRLYGIMTGDEGWQFVPQAMADERLSNYWGSRDFVRIVVFGNNGLFLNLNRSAMARDYLARQDQFGGWAYGGANDYFRVDSDLGGLCHGILHAQEMVMVIKTIAGRILNRQESYRKSRTGSISKAIQKVRFFRRELITTLDRVENLGIMEIGELEQLMLNSQKITPLIDSIKYLLELVEGELDLLYQQSTNRLVNILTVAGLLISGLSFIFGFFQ